MFSGEILVRMDRGFRAKSLYLAKRMTSRRAPIGLVIPPTNCKLIYLIFQLHCDAQDVYSDFNFAHCILIAALIMLPPVPSTASGSTEERSDRTLRSKFFRATLPTAISTRASSCTRGGTDPDRPLCSRTSKSFRNYRQGVRLHVNKNLVFEGLLLADNGIGVSSFDNNGPITFEDTMVIGLTAKARELVLSMKPDISQSLGKETGICKNCNTRIDGFKFASDPSHVQLSLRTVSFRGFEPHFDRTH